LTSGVVVALTALCCVVAGCGDPEDPGGKPDDAVAETSVGGAGSEAGYLSTLGQIHEQVRHLPEGAPVWEIRRE